MVGNNYNMEDLINQVLSGFIGIILGVIFIHFYYISPIKRKPSIDTTWREPNVQNAKIEYNEYISSKLHDLLPNNKKEAIAFLNKEIESLFELNALSSDFIEIIIVKEKINIVNYFCKKVRNLHWGLDGTAY